MFDEIVRNHFGGNWRFVSDVFLHSEKRAGQLRQLIAFEALERLGGSVGGNSEDVPAVPAGIGEDVKRRFLAGMLEGFCEENVAVVEKNRQRFLPKSLPAADRHGGDPNPEHGAGAFAEKDGGEVVDRDFSVGQNLGDSRKNTAAGFVAGRFPGRPLAVDPETGLNEWTGGVDEKSWTEWNIGIHVDWEARRMKEASEWGQDRWSTLSMEVGGEVWWFWRSVGGAGEGEVLTAKGGEEREGGERFFTA